MMMFGYFHIAAYPVPDFSPDFSDSGYGEYGRRDWYTYHVFSTGIGTTEMSYQCTSSLQRLRAYLTSI